MSIEPISRPPQAVVVALERVMAGVGERLANIEAEQGLLGCVLLGEKAWWRVASLVKAEDFMDPVHGRIWAAIAERKDRCETVDPIVLKAALAGDPELDERPNYLVELAANVVSVLQVEHYARQVAELADRRRFTEAAADAIVAALDMGPSVDEVAAEAVSRFQAVGRAEGLKSRRQVLEDLVKRTDRPPVRYSTGLECLDRGMEGGFYAGWTYGIAAPEKAGKTTLARTVSGNLNRQGIRHAYIALEMGSEQIEEGQVAGDLGFNSIAFRRGLSEDRVRELVRYAGSAPDHVTYIDRPGATQRELLRLVAQAKQRRGITGAIVDYLQLVRGRGRDQSEEQHLREVAQDWADFGRRHGLWILMLAQLNEEKGSVFGGRGLVKACDQLYYLRPGELEHTAWLQMEASRYTVKADLGSARDPVLELDMRGPRFRDFGPPPAPEGVEQMAMEGM